MRKPPDIQPPEALTHREFDRIEQTREYKLITPLFGGGVAPSEVDLLTPIRGSEIRGHLRFWWRATRGGHYDGKLPDMKKGEDALWGAASTKQGGGPSQVQIEILQCSGGKPKTPFSTAPEYVAFPLRQTPDKNLYTDISFTLAISYPAKYQKDVQAALWAWETFGGIGARTRRGFGALRLISVDGIPNTDLPPSNQKEAVVWIKHQLEQSVIAGTYPPGIPHLSSTSRFKVTDASQNPLDAWKKLSEKLASFRQNRNGPRGRSYWPEPEAIREITGQRSKEHQRLNHPHKFPRAAFGLPIIFHFKDANKGDPEDSTLQGMQEGSERLASPLILRPLVCRDQRAVGIALLLEGSRLMPPGGIVLDFDPTIPRRTQLTPTEAKAIPVLHGQTDVLLAFIDYL